MKVRSFCHICGEVFDSKRQKYCTACRTKLSPVGYVKSTYDLRHGGVKMHGIKMISADFIGGSSE